MRNNNLRLFSVTLAVVWVTLLFAACGGGGGGNAPAGNVVPPVAVIEFSGDGTADSGNNVADTENGNGAADTSESESTAVTTVVSSDDEPAVTIVVSSDDEPAVTTRRPAKTTKPAVSADEPPATTKRPARTTKPQSSADEPSTTAKRPAKTTAAPSSASAEPPQTTAAAVSSVTAAPAAEESPDGVELREGGSVTSKDAAQFPIIVGGSDVLSAEVKQNGTEFSVVISFTARGSAAFRAATARLAGTGTTISVWAAGSCVIAPIVTEEVTGDACTLYGGFDESIADDLAAAISRGIANAQR